MITDSEPLGFDPETMPDAGDAGAADFSGITPEQARAVFEHLEDREVETALRELDAARARARNGRELLEGIVQVLGDVAGAALRKVLS